MDDELRAMNDERWVYERWAMGGMIVDVHTVPPPLSDVFTLDGWMWRMSTLFTKRRGSPVIGRPPCVRDVLLGLDIRCVDDIRKRCWLSLPSCVQHRNGRWR